MNLPLARRPGLVLGTLTAVCLAAFLASIPLPRADGQLLGGDGFGYYVYLPSLVLDRDLDFTNQSDALGAGGSVLPAGRTPTGLRTNLWPAGPALLWLPFFLLAHGLALVLNAFGAGIRLDGCGYWHQSFVIAGNIVYGALGIALSFDAARRVASAGSALWATVTLVCAGSLVYYLTAEASMSHPVSVFAVGGFFALWTRERHRTGIRRAALLGASIGLIALVRTQEVLLVAAPMAADFAGRCFAPPGRPFRNRAGEWLRDALVTALVALAVYSPQALISAALFGTWWRPPQTYAAPGVRLFTWWSPHLLDVLFSARRGLFSWHPVFAVALAGLVPLWRRDRWLAISVVLGVVGQAYLLGGWYDWAQGRAFGGRAFIGCLPLFAMSLAALLDRAPAWFGSHRRLAAAAAASLAALLVAANILLLLEYRLALSWSDREATWHDLGARRLTFMFRPTD